MADTRTKEEKSSAPVRHLNDLVRQLRTRLEKEKNARRIAEQRLALAKCKTQINGQRKRIEHQRHKINSQRQEIKDLQGCLAATEQILAAMKARDDE